MNQYLDADRLAIVQKLENGTWKIFNGNEIGCLLAWWQLHVHNSKFGDKYNKKNLYYIASTVSSKMLGAIARKEGLTFEVRAMYNRIFFLLFLGLKYKVFFFNLPDWQNTNPNVSKPATFKFPA